MFQCSVQGHVAFFNNGSAAPGIGYRYTSVLNSGMVNRFERPEDREEE